MKSTIASIIIVIILIGGAILLSKGSSKVENNSQTQTDVDGSALTSNVTMEDGKQIITIIARGGYSPRKSLAKAGVPTILRFITNGAFDCSSSIRILSMNVNKILAQSGPTDIDLGVPKAGSLPGTCGMGMYSFEVDFQS